MYRILPLLLVSFAHGNKQMVYYPDDDGNVIYNNKAYHVQSPLVPFGSFEGPNRFNQGHGASVTKHVQIPPRGTPEYEAFVTEAISSGLMKLTVAINKVITNQSRNQYNNIVFAPVSVAASLALVLLGANGKTYQEISTLLGFATGVPDLDKKSQIVHEQFGKMILKLERTSGFIMESQVNFAIAIFVQNNFPIRKLYKNTAENIYQSEVLNLDFEQNPLHAQKSINAWVSDRTKGKIKEVLADAPSADTKVILASAMYFNAQWEYPFYEGATKRRRFYTNGKNQPSDIWVDMMSNGGDFPYYKDKVLDCEIIGFPYKGNRTTMYVVKPMNSTKEKLKSLEDVLTLEHLQRLVSNVQITSSVILFPKMLIDSTLDLKDPLKHLGISSLFNPAEANLALLSPGATAPIGNLTGTVNLGNSVINPISPTIPKNQYEGNDSVLIFNRFGDTVNCTDLFDKTNNNVTTCEQIVSNTTKKVIYKKIGDKIGRRIARKARSFASDDLDSLRENINRPENPTNFENPGLFADRVIHKVYMHITETGTEAAATTVFGLSKLGSRVIFRTEVPFFFFIMHEETKVVMFWGSVNRPTPFYSSDSSP
ncbi:serine protease inhibitor 28Dc [Harmonia axyridis]|uniref:serine protease inhibitor 28Dc n=1 Tax=Harmonia axyridis TaxID=115357 RepID=UPI001E2768CD|nr:serine protease inhibitor 28Dc [Harmonia axyridis]XP_045480350.1 serine protease inhibitor 28Dc [Harmonia axyridis]